MGPRSRPRLRVQRPGAGTPTTAGTPADRPDGVADDLEFETTQCEPLARIRADRRSTRNRGGSTPSMTFFFGPDATHGRSAAFLNIR